MTTAPRRFAERHVEIVNRGAYDQLAALFAPDALFLAPGQRVLNGRVEISAFFETFLPTVSPQVRIVSYVEQGNDCVYELEATVKGSSEYQMASIDHATLNEEGLVVRFTVWTK